MSNLVTSWLRTVVPGLWSAAVTAALAWLGTHAPWVQDVLDGLGIDPLSPGTIAFVVSVVLAAWYALWRKLEPYLPDWATRIVLGSAAVPVYVQPRDQATTKRLSDLGQASRLSHILPVDPPDAPRA